MPISFLDWLASLICTAASRTKSVPYFISLRLPDTNALSNKKAQHRSWHMAKCSKLYHLKWNINAWDTAMYLHGRHFILNLEICNPICIKLLQLMSGVITHNSVKTTKSILINGWVIASYVSGRHFVRHLGICYSEQFKKNVSISNRFPKVHKRGTHTHTNTHAHVHTHTYTHTHTWR